MASFTQSLKNPSYLHKSITILMFFASWGIWWSFFQLWLTNTDTGLGLSGGQVGTIYAVNSGATLVLMFVYGTLQDKLGLKRHLAIALAALTTLVGPFVVWVYEPLLRGESTFLLGVILGSIVLSAGFMAGVGLFEALTERFSRNFGYEYGQARSWGSFGYAVVALMAGFLFNINPHLNFWLGSVFGLVNLILWVIWKPEDKMLAQKEAAGEVTEEEVASTPSVRDMLAVFRVGHLWLIILIVMMTWTFYNVFDQQMFPAFYVSLFPTAEQGNATYGVLNSVQVFLEAAMMMVVPIIMRKVGVRNTLLLGILVMCVRITGCGVFDTPVTVSCVKLLHALEVPMFILPIFRYFTLHFNPKLSATLYMVGFQVSAQVGAMIVSTPLGALHDNIGYQPTFHIISGVVLVAGIIAFFVLKKDGVDVEGEPFYRDSELREMATQGAH